MSTFEEGDVVWLRCQVARSNNEQALIGFDSMEGPYSIRVLVSELRSIYLMDEDPV